MDLDRLVRQAGDLIRSDNAYMSKVASLSSIPKPADMAQIQAAEDLKKLLEHYEENQKEQARENKVNRWIAVVSMLVAVGSLIVSLVK